MKTFQSILLIYILFCLSTCKKFNEIEPVDPVVVLTGVLLQDSTNMIIGQIDGLGDGILQHGHVWSSNNNIPTTDDLLSELGSRTDIGAFESALDFPQAGLYFIRAYAEDVHGCVYYGEILDINISINQVIANFNFQDDCNAPCEVCFDNLSQNATTFTWNFGDGSIVSTADTCHLYQQAGSYNVTLIANGSTGVDSITKIVTIQDFITFERTYSGYTEGIKILELENGEYLIAGIIQDGLIANSSIFVVRMDKFGDIIPDSEYKYEETEFDIISDMIQLSNGEIVIVGSTIIGDNKDIFYLRMNEQGQPISGYPKFRDIEYSSNDDIAYSINEDLDGNLIISGTSSFESNDIDKNIFVIKISKDFSIVTFEEVYPSNENQVAYDLQVLDNSNYLLVGTSEMGYDPSNIKTFEINSNGIFMYENDLFTGNGYDYARAMDKNSESNFIVIGSTYSGLSSEGNVFIAEVNQNGNNISSFPISFGQAGVEEFGFEVKVLNNDSFIIVGGKDEDAYVVLLNQNGNELFSNQFGGISNDYFKDVIQTSDGGFAMTGTKGGILYFVKTNTSLNL